MKADIEGLEQTLNSLGKIESSLVTDTRKLVSNYGKQMAAQARSNAPIKDGYLESSIDILEETTTPTRHAVTWGVDEKKLGPGFTERGDPYHEKMEDGGYKLGPGSREKASQGHDVGPQYVDRALWEHLDDMVDAIEQAVADATKL